MPTKLPDHTTARRRQSADAAVTRRAPILFLALLPRRLPPTCFTALAADVALWLRCWRAAPADSAG